MKVSLELAQRYSNVNLTKIGKEKLLEKIGAQLGAIEEVEEWAPRYEGILVVRVTSCEPHPNADKLKVCLIDDGKMAKGVKRNDKGLIEVVCGAPNVQVGMIVAWLPPGSTVPVTLGKDPLKLEAREIRGVVSNGMLASASELGISDDHSGLLEIKSEEVGRELTKPGTALSKLFGLNDTVIDIENKMFTHRPDCFGVVGVARELAGIQGMAFKSPDWYTKEPSFSKSSDLPLKVVVEDNKLVPRFMAIAMQDIKVGPSPVWLQAGLTRVGIRPINNIVDLTNYYMYLTGQPLHAYDYDKIKALSDSTPTLVARQASKNEKLKLLNGKTLEFGASAIMIATDKHAVGVGGVMGGADTEVDETTHRIILECANFDMYSIRRTAMKHGLFTDAVTRFNKGQSPLQNDRIVAKIMADIQKLAGGKQASPVVDVHAQLPVNQLVHISAVFINERLGLSLTVGQITKLLENVEFKVRTSGKQLAVAAPFWRTDIAIPEDIVEEVGRLYGYDHLPLVLPHRDLEPAAKNELVELKSSLREILAEAGANEVLTYSFVHVNLLDNVGQDKSKAFQLSNALSPELQYYRLSLTPSLLDKVHPNIKAGYDEFALFEIGKAHGNEEFDDEGLPREFNRIALVYAAADKLSKETPAYYEAKLYASRLTQHQLVPFDTKLLKEHNMLEQMTALYEPMRSSLVWNGKMPVGVIGEFRAEVRRRLKLPDHTAGFELFLSALELNPHHYQPLPRFPKIEQDICLKVRTDLPYTELEGLVKEKLDSEKGNARLEISPLDIYQRENNQTHKQITFRVSIAAYERTLTDQEVNKLLDMVAEAAAEKFQAERI